MFEAERMSLRGSFGVCQSEQRPGLYLQMIATLAVADEFVSERDKFLGFTLILVVAGEAQGSHLGLRMISDTFSGVARLRVEVTSRASITAGMLLSGLL